ncbi:MAG: DUF302 domain-containing protein [Bacillota bacterium]
MIDYTIKKEFDKPMEVVLKEVKEELGKEGFGILSEIDMKETFKEKLEKDFRKYKIMGACNPKFAYEGLQSEDDLGVLLPCNFVVYENEDNKTTVAAIDPVKLLSLSENKDLVELGEKIKNRFKKAINKM